MEWVSPRRIVVFELYAHSQMLSPRGFSGRILFLRDGPRNRVWSSRSFQRAAISGSPKNAWKVLDLQEGADIKAVRKRFRELAAIEHPDKRSGDLQAPEKFRRLVLAYRELLDAADPDPGNIDGIKVETAGGFDNFDHNFDDYDDFKFDDELEKQIQDIMDSKSDFGVDESLVEDQGVADDGFLKQAPMQASGSSSTRKSYTETTARNSWEARKGKRNVEANGRGTTVRQAQRNVLILNLGIVLAALLVTVAFAYCQPSTDPWCPRVEGIG